MASRGVKIAGYTFIAIVMTFFVVVIAATALEYTGISRWLLADGEDDGKRNRLPLHKSGYYGQILDESPYLASKVQHLHPYYLFSLPWRPEDIAAANNPYVTVNDQGSRVSGIEEADADAILLGGSTAFGAFSSNDSHTLAYRLNALTPFRFANRNSPSWNSHQELVAAAKFPHPYKLSVSFTLSNDIDAYCFEAAASRFVDQPESFDRLATYFNDIRGDSLGGGDGLVERLFPDTVRFVGQLIGGDDKKGNGTQVKFGEYCEPGDIESDAKAIAASFLQNQQQLAYLAAGMGGKHLVVLQPSFVFYEPSTATVLKRRVYELVMANPWCASHCLDLSRIPGVDQPAMFDGTNASTAIFADRVHLTDLGVEVVVQALVPFVTAQ